MVTSRFVPDGLSEGDRAQECHQVTLEPLPRSVAVARRFVRSHAPDVPAETAASLELLTSELVTNAVLHARTVLDVELLVTSRTLVVGVHDLDLTTALQTPYTDREGGWGLSLVAALAQDWAIDHHPGGGKTVWFRLPRSGAVLTGDGAAARTDADRRDS